MNISTWIFFSNSDSISIATKTYQDIVIELEFEVRDYNTHKSIPGCRLAASAALAIQSEIAASRR